jgi:hypothetical protein
MPTLDELLVKIDASTELLRRELKSGEGAVDGFQRKVSSRLDRVDRRFAQLGGTIKKALATFGVGLSVAGITKFTMEAIKAGDAIAKSANAANLAGERFQRLQYAFDRGGVSSEQFSTAMQRLNRGLGQFIQTGGGPAAKAIEQLGLAADISSGKIRNTEQLFDAVVRQLQGVKNEAEAAAIAASLFGDRVGPRFVQTLRLGSRGLEELEQSAKGVLSKEQLDAAEALNDAFGRMAATVGGTLKGAFISAADAALRFFRVPEALRSVDDIDSVLAKLNSRLKARQNSLRFITDDFNRGLMQSDIDSLEAEITMLQSKRDRILRGERAQGLGIEEIDINVQRRLTPLRLQGKEEIPDVIDFKKIVDAREQIDSLEQQSLRAQGRVADAIRRQADQQIRQWQRVAQETPILADEAQKAIAVINERAAADIERLTEKSSNELTEAERRAQQFGDAFASAFESRGIDALLSGKLSDAVRGFARDLAQLIIRLSVLRPLAEGLAGGSGGFLGKLFGGGRARGGRVSPGRFNVVGENGPELFVPDVPGRILSNAQSSRMGGGGQVVNQTINTPLVFPPQLEAFVRNVAAPAGRDAAMAVLNAQRGRM